MILDKLLEKKDLKAFCRYRICELKLELKGIKKIPPKERKGFRLGLRGRIREVKHLLKNIDRIKAAAVDAYENSYHPQPSQSRKKKYKKATTTARAFITEKSKLKAKEWDPQPSAGEKTKLNEG